MPDHPHHYISFSSEFNPSSSEALLGICSGLANDGVQEVTLLLSTPGGRVNSGITVYNLLRAMPFKLTTYNVGSVNSIGNVVFLAGEERYAVPNSTFMFHGVGFDIETKTRLEEKGLKEKLNSLKADQKKIGAIISERTNLNARGVAGLFLAASTKDPNYAKANGIINEVRDLKLKPGVPIHQLIFKR